MAKRKSLLRVLFRAGVAPALALFCLLVSYTPLFEYLNLKSFDILLRLSPRRPVSRRVLVVGIDDRSIGTVGRLPWDRGVIAQLIDRTDAGKPAAIGIDLFFDTPVPSDPELAASIRRCGRVILPVALVSEPGGQGKTNPLLRWVRPLPEFRPAAEGHANSTPDSDGICRRLTLSRSANKVRFWALALELWRLAEGKNEPLHELDDSLDSGACAIPARRADGYNVLIHYGSNSSPVPVISAADVLSGNWDPKAAGGAVVLLGVVSPLEADQLFTPISTSGQAMPGVLIHAHAVNMFLEKSFLVEATQAAILIAILIGVAAALALMQWSRSPWHWIGFITLLAAAFAVACGLFWYRNYVFPLPTLLFSILTAAAAFHIERLASVRHALRSEVREFAERLPRASKHAYSDPLIEQALDMLRRQMRWDWLELHLRSGHKELMRLRSGGRNENLGAAVGAFEFADAELRTHFIHPVAQDGVDAGLRVRLGHAIAHEIFASRRVLEVQRGSPRWGELLRRGYDEWQLSVLRQLGTEWLDNDSARDAVLECMGGGILLLDFTGRVSFVNRPALRLLPFLSPPPARMEFFDMLRQEGLLGVEESAQYPASLSTPGYSFELAVHCDRWPRPDILMRCSAIHSADGIYLGSSVSLTDQTDQRRLDATRREMTALVAHELRTPLASIHGFAQQLERYALDPERIHRVAEIILRESSRLDQMTRSYLDLTRLEQQAAQTEMEPVDLASIVETAVEGMMAAAENSEIKLHTDCLVDDLRVRGNAVFLERAVSNLLSNAIKYGGRQSQVRIRVSADRLQACVEVRDQGPGIPAEAIPHIFDKFYRVKSAATASIPGSGLGLAYVREVAQQHGGSVAVESSSGAGSAFTLRIPLWGRE